MAIPYQQPLAASVWLLGLADALRQGISVHKIEWFAASDRSISWVIPAFGLLFPPVAVVITWVARKFWPHFGRYRPGYVGRWVDRRWGAGSATEFLRTLRPVALVACGALILGGVGLFFSLRHGSSVDALEVSLFFVAGGIGFAVGGILKNLLIREEPWT